MQLCYEHLNFLIGLLVFWLIVYAVGRIFKLERYGLRIYPAYINYQSPFFIRTLRRVSDRYQALWKVLSNVGIPLAFGQMAYAIYFLWKNLNEFLEPEGTASPVLPLLPGLTVRLLWLPYLLIAVVTAIIVHEAAHGIIARNENVRVKSAGAIILLVIPGGYVEPDEDSFEKSALLSKLRILAAGSTLNLLCGLLIFILILFLFSNSPSGVVIVNTVDGGPLQLAGVTRWDVIYSINSTPIRGVRDLIRYLANTTQKTIILGTNKGEIVVSFRESPFNGTAKALHIIGIRPPLLNYYESRFGLGPTFDVHVYLTLYWTFIIQVSVAVMNMLPIYPLDGEKFVSYLLRTLLNKNAKWIEVIINGVCLSLIITNMVLSTLRSLIIM